LEWWHEHLKSAAEYAKTLDGRDTKEIGNLLLKLLRDETLVEEWSAWTNDKFYTIDIPHAILKFLYDDNFLKSLSAETREWVNAAMSNPAEIFIPAAKVTAVMWLQRHFWSPWRLHVSHSPHHKHAERRTH
jgi:hypothetical protein